MDALTDIWEIAPTDPAILPLIERHTRFAHAHSPACSVHTMSADELVSSGSQFFAVIENGEAVAMGALKKLSGSGGELKSMHVREGRRGDGLADAILSKIIEAARLIGMSSLYLETGSQDAFKPARAFYLRHGFDYCPPFEGYVEDPASVFMTRPL